jgi:hypothetical protein
MLYIYLLCTQCEHQKNPFQSKQSKHFHQRNWFAGCETGSNNVKLPKVGSNALWGQGSTNQLGSSSSPFVLPFPLWIGAFINKIWQGYIQSFFSPQFCDIEKFAKKFQKIN